MNAAGLLDRDPSSYSRFERFVADELEAGADDQSAVTSFLGTVTALERLQFGYAWNKLWARPSQRLPTSTDWMTWFIRAGRGFGKALAVETQIVTPNGWTTMGALTVGDTVFDETGAPCTVTGVYDQGAISGWHLTFSDGATLDACDEHLWVTVDALERKRRNRSGCGLTGWADAAPITTAKLVDTLTTSTRRRDRNHSVPVAGPLAMVERALPIDPYLLGVWLGDGSSAGAEITCHDDDAPHYVDAAARAGETLRLARRRHADRPVGTWTLAGRNGGTLDQRAATFHGRLARLAVLHAKHVPTMYLRASVAQRLALLQGLMDTDGTISATGQAEFTSTRRCLASAVLELARTLGEKPVMAEGLAQLNGVYMGPKWRVTWRATIPVVTLPRKAARLRPLGAQAMRNSHRMVCSAQRIHSRPMRCITVDSPSALFLAGEAMIPTHNTRTGSEAVRKLVNEGRARAVTIIGPTAADARDIMIEGPESGLLVVHPDNVRPKYSPSKRLLEWPNGALGHVRSAEEPDGIRGLNSELVWGDEPAAWSSGKQSWDNAQLGLRLGKPHAILTGTPRPVEWLRAIEKEPTTIVTTGSTYENVGNLAPEFIRLILSMYEGTRLGRQELHALYLEDVEGALWTMATIDATRVATFNTDAPWASLAMSQGVDVRRRLGLGAWAPTPGDYRRPWETWVAVDPPGETAECGIIVVTAPKRARAGYDHCVVLDDRSVKGPPEEWGSAVVKAVHDYNAVGAAVEKNQGGDMVRSTIHAVDSNVRVDKITAKESKYDRAEPVSTLMAKGWVHFVGHLPLLEQQLTNWVSGESGSPDRLDAFVHAVTKVMNFPGGRSRATVGSPLPGGPVT